MSEVVAVVEGLTEQMFFRDVLAPWLGHQGVYVSAAPVGKPGHKGGNVYAAAKRDMMNFLKQRPDTYVTCFFDFYGMKNDWPGRKDASAVAHDSKPAAVEKEVKSDILAAFPAGFRKERLIPYVQVHEFESLLFSYPPALSLALGDKDSEEEFQRVRDEFETPEHINDNPNTAPSKRIITVFEDRRRRYRKPLHASIAAKEITIETMREECPHFRQWVDLLVALGG